MSWWARCRDDEDGLTLIEVVASLMIFGVLIAGTAGLTLSGLRGLAVSRMDTVGKNLTQERLEKMRNLPFFVSATITGGSPDLLDKYYVNTSTLASSTTSTGFVSSTGARDVANGDPATGPFYRTICQQPAAPGSTCSIASGDPRFVDYTQRITVQLLNGDGSYIPSPTFDSTSTGIAGLEPAQIVGVTITTLWKAANTPKKYSVYSKISDTASKVPIVSLQARLSAFRFSGQLPSSRELLLESGVIDLNGSLSSSTAASAVATGAHGAIDNGVQVMGATDYIAAPPSGSHTGVSQNQFTLQDTLTSALVAQMGGSSVANVGASTLNGNPSSATSTSPVTATMLGGGAGGNNSLTADNEPSNARLRLEGPVVQVYAPGCGNSCAAVVGSGYLASTGGATHSATASVSTTLGGTLELFPTDFAPGGVLQVTLNGAATLTCKSQAGSTPAASSTATYSATVKYWNGTTYSNPINLAANNSADPLASIVLNTTQVGVDPSGQPLYLSDYLQSWSSLAAPGMTASTKLTTSGTSVATTFPGFLTIQSVPLRTEADSTFGVQLGAATCTAGDLR